MKRILLYGLCASFLMPTRFVKPADAWSKGGALVKRAVGALGRLSKGKKIGAVAGIGAVGVAAGALVYKARQKRSPFMHRTIELETTEVEFFASQLAMENPSVQQVLAAASPAAQAGKSTVMSVHAFLKQLLVASATGEGVHKKHKTTHVVWRVVKGRLHLYYVPEGDTILSFAGAYQQGVLHVHYMQEKAPFTELEAFLPVVTKKGKPTGAHSFDAMVTYLAKEKSSFQVRGGTVHEPTTEEKECFDLGSVSLYSSAPEGVRFCQISRLVEGDGREVFHLDISGYDDASVKILVSLAFIRAIAGSVSNIFIHDTQCTKLPDLSVFPAVQTLSGRDNPSLIVDNALLPNTITRVDIEGFGAGRGDAYEESLLAMRPVDGVLTAEALAGMSNWKGVLLKGRYSLGVREVTTLPTVLDGLSATAPIAKETMLFLQAICNHLEHLLDGVLIQWLGLGDDFGMKIKGMLGGEDVNVSTLDLRTKRHVLDSGIVEKLRDESCNNEAPLRLRFEASQGVMLRHRILALRVLSGKGLIPELNDGILMCVGCMLAAVSSEDDCALYAQMKDLVMPYEGIVTLLRDYTIA